MTSTKKTRKPKKRMGRPPLPAKARKGVNLTFRARGDLREWLGAAAEKSDRSISEEIEQVLEFYRQGGDLILRALGGKDAARVIRPLVHYLGRLEEEGIDWKSEAVKEGLVLILDGLFREKPLSVKEWMPRLIYSKTAAPSETNAMLIALMVLQLYGLAEPHPQQSEAEAEPE